MFVFTGAVAHCASVQKSVRITNTFSFPHLTGISQVSCGNSRSRLKRLCLWGLCNIYNVSLARQPRSLRSRKRVRINNSFSPCVPDAVHLEIPVPVQNANVCGVCLIYRGFRAGARTENFARCRKKNAGSLNYILDLCSWDIVI